MPGRNEAAPLVTGTLDWTGGVNSIKVTTQQSEANPNGLAPNEVAWLINATVRDGGVYPRAGWKRLCRIHEPGQIYQGGYFFRPLAGDPYLVFCVGGITWMANPTTCKVDNLTSAYLPPQITGALPDQTVTIKNLNRNLAPNEGVTINGVSFPNAPGGAFTFQVPQIGQTVVVVIPGAYTGNVGDVISVGAIDWQVTAFTAVSFTSAPGANPPALTHYFFCQAERFLLIQAGDGITLPLIWDGSILTRSIGINNTAAVAGTPGVNQIPAGTCMTYFMGRLWYAQGRQYSAGDIVKGPSGTASYNFLDSVLAVTENPLVLGGDGFTIPSDSGDITALTYNAALDTSVGQGRLFISSRSNVFAQQVPVTRGDWINASSTNGPLQTVIQIANGSVNDRSMTAVNGDLFYQSLEPGIRPLISAVRYANQWQNTAISKNENRVFQFNNRALMEAASGINFDNRMLQTVLPAQTPEGIISKAIVPLDFLPISGFNSDSKPVWEGVYEGLDFLQLFTGQFGGLQRAFGVVRAADSSLELWELTQADRFDTNAFGESRITWITETPAYTWGDEFLLKKLVAAELWIDRLSGTVDFKVEWRPDSDPCWKVWHQWQSCSARDCTEDSNNPCTDTGYPVEKFGDGYRSTLTLPAPPLLCASLTGRPATQGYQFQLRITAKGYCRLRGVLLYAEPMHKALYQGKVC